MFGINYIFRFLAEKLQLLQVNSQCVFSAHTETLSRFTESSYVFDIHTADSIGHRQGNALLGNEATEVGSETGPEIPHFDQVIY